MASFESLIIYGILLFCFFYFAYRVISLLEQIRDRLKRAFPDPEEEQKPKKEYPDFDKLIEKNKD